MKMQRHWGSQICKNWTWTRSLWWSGSNEERMASAKTIIRMTLVILNCAQVFRPRIQCNHFEEITAKMTKERLTRHWDTGLVTDDEDGAPAKGQLRKSYKVACLNQTGSWLGGLTGAWLESPKVQKQVGWGTWLVWTRWSRNQWQLWWINAWPLS